MPWSDAPTVIKKILNYFGPDKHEQRVLRKFIGRWDKIRAVLSVEGKRAEKHLKMMDKLRKELR